MVKAPTHIPTLTTALIEDDWQRRRPRRTAGGHVGVGRRHEVGEVGVPHGLAGRDSSVWFEVQHFLWRKKNKIILFAYLIIAFGLCQKTQSSAKYQKNPKSINVFVKCQNLEQHVARNNINLMVEVRNSTFSVEKNLNNSM